MSNSRVRTTWKGASAPPAMPSEDGGHPASYPDPGVDDYGTGNPSDWAEDPHPGPYGPGQSPAIPTEDGDHPATKRAHMELVAHYQGVALKAVKVASALLGKNASADAREMQAMAFMDLGEAQLDATLNRLSEYRSDFMSMDMDDMDEDVMDEDMEAEMMLAEMLDEDSDEDDAESKEAEMMLAEMLAEEESDEDDAEGKEAEMMLAEMLQEANQNDPAGPTLDPDVIDPEDDFMGGEYFEDEDIVMDDGSADPMGLMAEEPGQGFEDIVADFFGKNAGDDEDEDGEAEKEDEGKEAKQATRQRPQPRKPSKGPKSLGTVNLKAASSETSELENLWKSAPDVSQFFGNR